MRFKGLDLNLLVALDVLLAECSVSRAAERLHLSQPSVSAALARLREYFDDPLLELHGKRMVATPRALELRPLLTAVLADIDRNLLQSRRFEPATADRWFSLCLSDYLVTVLGPTLVSTLQQEAPGVKLDLQRPSEMALARLEQGSLDLLIVPEEHCLPDHPSELLLEERHVVVGCIHNPQLARPIGLEDFQAASHVVVDIGAVQRGSFAERQLQSLQPGRRIEVRASSFTQVPDLLLGTTRISVMHERLARVLAARLPIAWQPLPFAMPTMAERIQYHRSRRQDPALRWLIERLQAAAAH
ncbi:MAG: hypothetical protein RLZZ200_585 [Pseudomonadota bacterium]|jgi:DNA-binding transcriptional LysR family regulator